MNWKKWIFGICLTTLITAACNKENPGPIDPPAPEPIVPERTGDSRISYQILVYSFADSDGDGIGDFNGIRHHLDYLKAMGVQAVWLSPIHPSTSYHGYDVENYSTVNPLFGDEDDFKALLDAAHSAGIKVYIDYVLNHSSKEHPWFIAGKTDDSSKYRNYYHFSETSKSGYSVTVQGNNPGKIKVRFTLLCNSSGIPQSLKAEQVDTVINNGSKSTGKYLWYGSVTEQTMPEFYSAGNNTYTLSLEMETLWGVLVRTSKTEWGNKKFGAASESSKTLAWGVPLNLKASSDIDILMPWMKSIWYQSVFGSYMPDLNYGPVSTCETTDSFKEICSAADKWINMGVDGFRLDAVKHIYDSETSDDNPTFLKKFYDHCNATFKNAGHSDNIYMVGEQWNEPGLVAPYYKGLNAFFEFAFWWRLSEGISQNSGKDFAKTICEYHSKYAAVRNDAIAATKLTNHDENRAADDLGRNKQKIKLSACVLLTSGGEPYIYQGEELGYWGTKTGGDEYVRTPILWNRNISSAASAALQGKIDASMLTADISVENQIEDKESILNLYRKFGVLRDRYEALAKGKMTAKTDISNNYVSAWFMEQGTQKILVIHNFSASRQKITPADVNTDHLIASNGNVTASNGTITLDPYASALYLQQ